MHFQSRPIPPRLDFELRRLLQSARRRLPLDRPLRVEWRHYPVTAGRAYLSEGVICLSTVLLTTPTRLRDTLLHEYAHLVVFERFGRRAKPHGSEWKQTMLCLGVHPEVTHRYPCEARVGPKPYVCRCEECGSKIPRTRPLMRGRRYRHVGCGGRVVPEKGRR